MQKINSREKPNTIAYVFFYAISSACFVFIAAMPTDWVLRIFGIEVLTPTTILALIVSAIILVSCFKNPPRLTLLPSVLIAVGAFGTIAFINLLPQLSLSFTLIGIFGFIGLVPQWRQWWGVSLFAALLIALVLPFGVSSQTGFGFFVRVAVTDAAAQILNLFGMTLLSSHDVLILENNLARIDAPCSGLKSLFTGSAFFFAASAILRRPMSVRWLLIYSAFLVFLIAGNVTRIIILVLMLEVLKASALAELLHIPLGIIFFTIACAIATWLLVALDFNRQSTKTNITRRSSPLLGSFISLCGVCLALLLAPMRSDEMTEPSLITAPTDGSYESLPLTLAETRFFGANPNTAAKKWRFTTEALSGSLLIVRSSAVTAMHAPEICLEANGFEIRDMSTRTLPHGETLRELSLGTSPMHAIYWMQSHAGVTDSFTTRLKRYALNGENDWVLVTILFDNDPNFTSEMTTEYFNKLRQHIDALLIADKGRPDE